MPETRDGAAPHPDGAHLKGIALFVTALLFFAALDATSKHLSQKFAVPLLVWARYTLHFLLMLIVLAPSMRARLVTTRRPVMQVTRALMLVGVTGFAMAAFRVMPLAEATAILFVTPMIVALMAGPLLGEHMTPVRWLAVLAGFAGMLLIARPGGELPAAGVAFALAGALCYAIYQVQTRQLSPTESTLTMLFYTALVGTVSMSLTLPWFWHGPAPDALELLMICSLGLYGGTGHLLLTRAFRYAPASLLSPFLYSQLIWATLLGWGLYDALPDAAAFAGMAIIAASGIVLALAARPAARR